MFSINMTVAELDMYLSTLDEVENNIIDDSKFPVVKDSKLKNCCYATLEVVKMCIIFIKYNISYATKKDKSESKTKNKIG